MQAYQSAPCPYCGATWNQPGAQTCANCRNPLPPPQASYTPPGYAPGPGQGQAPPGQGQAPPYPTYAPPAYPGYSQPQYPGAPVAYPGPPGQPAPGYPGYAPPGYGQNPGYQQPPGYGPPPGYPAYEPGSPPSGAGGTSFQLLGQTLTIPVALPAALLPYLKPMVKLAVGAVGLLIVLFGVMPAVASGQISGAEQAVATTVSHQPKVDAGFAAFFAPDPGSTDLNVIKAHLQKDADSVNNALAIVQADESALKGADLRLSVLGWLALPSRTAILRERLRLNTAINGLKQADDALTAGSNQDKVLLPALDAMIDFSKMYAAVNKRDLVGAGAPYPDAQQKLQLAMSLDHARGIPDAVVKFVNGLNDLVENMEKLVQAIQNKDAAGTKQNSDKVQAGLKTMTTLSDALPADFLVKTYGPMQKAYDSAIKSLKSPAR